MCIQYVKEYYLTSNLAQINITVFQHVQQDMSAL